jgi:hypothetical protein
MKHFTVSAVVVAVMLAFSAMLVSPAPAGAATDQVQGTPPAVSGETPNDGELSNFVAAFVRLMGVQHGYIMLMQDEQDPAKLEQMKQSAVADMTQAVEKDGLSVDRYNQIALAVRDDPELQGKVETILQQLAEVPPEAAPVE